MPSDYCIFRVASAEEARGWINAFKEATYGPHPKWVNGTFMGDDMDPTASTVTSATEQSFRYTGDSTPYVGERHNRQTGRM